MALYFYIIFKLTLNDLIKTKCISQTTVRFLFVTNSPNHTFYF
jgi:hypothetical protein